MNNVKEPYKPWGGSWTERKLQAFEAYVNAYLTIMNAQKDKYNGWPTTIYFDGFAGSGKRNILSTDDEKLFKDITNDELTVYKGSAERVLSIKNKFDEYYFVDNDPEAINTLKENLSSKNLLTDNCKFIVNDVNKELKRFSKYLDEKKAALILLDPFGMQLNWESIELLKNRRVDLWILLPSGVIINRFLDRKGKLLFGKKLQSFFGMSEEKIREIFYKTETIETLFDTENRIIKVSDSITKIADVYIQRLKNIFKFVTNEPLKLLNTKGIPIYHFVFASNNQTALNIAKYIIGKKQK
ncbi:MAG: three-Cys-motif partner protein TcmP [Ignavibacteria bacterium]